MPRLSEALGGPDLWIKRDDCTGLSTGGNKTRKLEFLMADAQHNNADTIITQGATQSNHARQTTAAAAKLGMECHVLLEDRTGSADDAYVYGGNVLLDQLHGSTISRRPPDTDMDVAMEELAQRLRDEGKTPYIIPGGGSNHIGALGYVNAAIELMAQANDRSLRIDHLLHATGSAGTQAGLVLGMEGMNSGIPVYGVCVGDPKAIQEEKVYDLAQRTAEFMGLSPDIVARDKVVANSDYIGDGYGLATDGAIRRHPARSGLLRQGLFRANRFNP